ncbi:hypothetical protein AB205_0183380 [Aquarana catesbeiana]|uniref:Uncharacterized protein n=1 Tax=Aquarana catesbeiana TaxID=8400 RepID=A0A2G9RD97_AQUCT|nr:hypothetical protein AB205_0183380 [Aquarana catesbeiana]
MPTRFCVRRGHSAAVYTSVIRGGPHRCSSVYYRGVSICEACRKQVSIQA